LITGELFKVIPKNIGGWGERKDNRSGEGLKVNRAITMGSKIVKAEKKNNPSLVNRKKYGLIKRSKTSEEKGRRLSESCVGRKEPFLLITSKLTEGANGRP